MDYIEILSKRYGISGETAVIMINERIDTILDDYEKKSNIKLNDEDRSYLKGTIFYDIFNKGDC